MISWPAVIMIVAAAVAITLILSGISFTGRVKRKVDYMLDALDDGETNFRFGRGKLLNRGLNRTLNRLRDIFDKETRYIRETERYYGRMLDNVSTGIIVSETGTGRVVYSNRRASGLLGLSKIGRAHV